MTEYEDYRAWLRAWIAERPLHRSQRALARRLGLASSYVNMVVSGKRKLAVDEAESWAEVLKLTDDERVHWQAMIRSAHGHEAERQDAQVELHARRAFAKARQMPTGIDAFSSWHTFAILELARCRGFRCDPEWIASAMRPQISVEEAYQSLQALLEAGFIVRTRGTGAKASTTPVVVPGVPPKDQLERVKRLHRDQLAYAATVLDQPAEDRHVISMVFAVAPSALPELKSALDKAIRNAVQAASGDVVPTQVFQVSVQLVPRSKRSQRSRRTS